MWFDFDSFQSNKSLGEVNAVGHRTFLDNLPGLLGTVIGGGRCRRSQSPVITAVYSDTSTTVVAVCVLERIRCISNPNS